MAVNAADDGVDPWGLVEAALERAPAWAPPLFVVVCGNKPDRKASARWLLRSTPGDPSVAYLADRLAAELPPRHAWAVQRWADVQLGRPRAEEPFLDAWLAAAREIPAIEVCRSLLKRAVGARESGARFLLCCALAGGDEVEKHEMSLHLRRHSSQFPECVALLKAFADDEADVRCITDGDLRRGRADAALKALLVPVVGEDVTRARQEFLKGLTQAKDDVKRFKTSHCQEAWLAFLKQHNDELQPLLPLERKGHEALYAAGLRETLERLVGQHEAAADAANAAYEDRQKMDGWVVRLRDLGLAVVTSYERSDLQRRGRQATRDAWSDVLVPAIQQARAAARADTLADALAAVDNALATPRVSQALSVEPLRGAVQAMAHEARRMLRELSLEGTGARLLATELAALRNLGLEGAVAAGQLESVADGGPHARLPKPRPLPNGERERVAALFQPGGVPLESWRFHLAPPERCVAALGEDVLEELAGRSGADHAVTAYLARREFRLAREAAKALPAEIRSDMDQRIAEALDATRTETRANLDALVLAPLGDMLLQWPGDEPNEASRITELGDEARGLRAVVDTGDPSEFLSASEHLATRTRGLLDEHGRRRAAARERLERELGEPLRSKGSAALDLSARARAARAYALFLEGHLGLALRALDGELRDGPPTVPEVTAAGAVPRGPSLRPRTPLRSAPMDPNRLATPLRIQVLPSRSLGVRPEISEAYAGGDPSWRHLLARAALDEAYERAAKNELRFVPELARDAAWLFDHDAEEGREHSVREALVLWLAVAPALNPTALPADEPVIWETLRGDASLELVHRLTLDFFRRRAGKDLAELVCEAVDRGGAVANDLLLTMDRLGGALKLWICCELIRSAPSTDLSASIRAGACIKELLDLALGDVVARGLMIPSDDWNRAANDQRFHEELHAAGADQEQADKLIGALRERSRAGGVLPEIKLSVRVLAGTIYLDAPADSLGFFVHIRNDSKGLSAVLRNATLRASLEGEGLGFRSTNDLAPHKAQIIKIDVLRPQSGQDVFLPLEVVSGESAPERIRAPLELLDVLGRALPSKGSERASYVTLRAEYPPALRQCPSPYPTGADLALSSIEGRDDIIDKVFKRLKSHGTDSPVFIVGPRRIGKSTVLRKLRYTPKFTENYEIVSIDLEGTLSVKNDSTCSFLEKVAARIQAGLQTAAAREVPPPRAIPPADPEMAFSRYLNQVATHLGSRRLMLMLDEFQLLFVAIAHGQSVRRTSHDQVVSEDLIGWFRTWIQHSPVAFVIAGQEREMRRSVEQREHRLFGLGDWIPVRALTQPAAVAMVERLKRHPEEGNGLVERFSWLAVETALELTGRHPFLLTLLGSELVSRLQAEHRTHVGVGDIETAARAVLGKPGVSQSLPTLRRPAERAVLWALACATVDGVPPTRAEIRDSLVRHGMSAFQAEVDAVLDEHVTHDEPEMEIFAAVRSRDGQERYRTNPALLARAIAKRTMRAFVLSGDVGTGGAG